MIKLWSLWTAQFDGSNVMCTRVDFVPETCLWVLWWVQHYHCCTCLLMCMRLLLHRVLPGVSFAVWSTRHESDVACRR